MQTHFDLSSNIACVVGGRRRFTLFPPDQLPNLYIGPIEFNISGPPISMVPLEIPDLARFPRFAEALRHSRSAELAPGDAIFIPYGWWHHVESLAPFNVLANYWWNDARQAGSPFDCMLHAILALRDLPPDQRAVWRTMFEHYVFTAPDEALAHLPREQRGMSGPAFRRARPGNPRHPGEHIRAAIGTSHLEPVGARGLARKACEWEDRMMRGNQIGAIAAICA